MKVKTIFLIFALYFGIKFLLNYLSHTYSNRLVFYDVGQGDSILIASEDGKKMLVDGGPDYKISSLLSNEFILNTCILDYVLLTHPHADHLKGLTRIINNCKVGVFLVNSVVYTSNLYTDFLASIERLKTNTALIGDIYTLGHLKLYIFWPRRSDLTGHKDNVNDISTVLLLDYGKFEALFTGDLESTNLANLDYKKMKSLIQDGLDVLKVPHHGSQDSLYNELYILLEPKVCIISVGRENKYGHPDKAVIDFLNYIGCSIRRTDLEGTIEILFD